MSASAVLWLCPADRGLPDVAESRSHAQQNLTRAFTSLVRRVTHQQPGPGSNGVLQQKIDRCRRGPALSQIATDEGQTAAPLPSRARPGWTERLSAVRRGGCGSAPDSSTQAVSGPAQEGQSASKAQGPAGQRSSRPRRPRRPSSPLLVPRFVGCRRSVVHANPCDAVALAQQQQQPS